MGILSAACGLPGIVRNVITLLLIHHVKQFKSFANLLRASLLQNESDAFRKMRLRVEEVQGKNCLTNFWVSL